MSAGEVTTRPVSVELLASLRALALAARRIDVVPCESLDESEARERIAPLMHRLVQTASTLYGRIAAETLRSLATDPEDDWLGAAIETPERRTAAACGLAATEMCTAMAALDASDSPDPWHFLAACNQARGTVIRTATAVERALCEVLGEPTQLGTIGELSTARTVRRAYRRFARALTALGASALTARLAATSHAIDRLESDPIYRELRFSDRHALRTLSRRLDAWLAQANGAAPAEGERLWEETLLFARLMLEVNRRQELVEHDREALLTLLGLLLDAAAPGVQLDAGWLSRVGTLLARLEGYDDPIDRSSSDPRGAGLLAAVVRAATAAAPREAETIIAERVR